MIPLLIRIRPADKWLWEWELLLRSLSTLGDVMGSPSAATIWMSKCWGEFSSLVSVAVVGDGWGLWWWWWWVSSLCPVWVCLLCEEVPSSLSSWWVPACSPSLSVLVLVCSRLAVGLLSSETVSSSLLGTGDKSKSKKKRLFKHYDNCKQSINNTGLYMHENNRVTNVQNVC